MMMAPPIPPSPQADAAAVGAVPASRWRVTAAGVLDYLGFCVLWQLAVHFLVVGPPPPGWIVLPVFFAFEWTLVRHWRTPAMGFLALSRIPAGPGRDLWVVDADPAQRENALSLLTGLLFMAEGFRLWAQSVAAPEALSPLFWVLRGGGGGGSMLAFLWGGLSLATGRAFLRLAPRAPLLGVFMLLVTLTSISVWPEAWGTWFVNGLDLRGAADAAWLRVWFPVAAWLVCALVTLVIAGNGRPFRRPPASGDAPAAPAAPARTVHKPARKRFDMPVGRAAQATVLVMLVGLLAGWGLTAFAVAWGDWQDRDSRRLVEQVLPRVAAEWDPAPLAAVAGGQLKPILAGDRGRAVFARYARLGALVQVDRVDGESVIRFLPKGREVTASYTVEARFAGGPAEIDVGLRREGTRWTIHHFNVQSPALAGPG